MPGRKLQQSPLGFFELQPRLSSLLLEEAELANGTMDLHMLRQVGIRNGLQHPRCHLRVVGGVTDRNQVRLLHRLNV
jgi:hypothetical protein